MQELVGTLRGAVVDALAQRCGAGGEFGYGKIFHIFLNVDDNVDDNYS